MRDPCAACADNHSLGACQKVNSMCVCECGNARKAALMDSGKRIAPSSEIQHLNSAGFPFTFRKLNRCYGSILVWKLTINMLTIVSNTIYFLNACNEFDNKQQLLS